MNIAQGCERCAGGATWLSEPKLLGESTSDGVERTARGGAESGKAHLHEQAPIQPIASSF